MNSGTGIQELMAAETRASQIVAEARIGMFLQRALLPCFHGLDIKINVFISCVRRIGDNFVPFWLFSTPSLTALSSFIITIN